MGSSSKVPEGAKSYNYYGTLAGAICWGPVDTLHALIVDGKTIVTGPVALESSATNLSLDPGSEHYLDKGGRITIYRGDQTTADEALADHPPYAGLCYVVLEHMLFGRERTTAPNIQAIVSRTPVVPDGILESEHVELTTDGQANPFAILAELATSPHGLGLPAESLDATSWAAAAAWAADSNHKARTYCSPLLTSQADARTVIASLLEMADAALYWTHEGKLAVALIQPGVTPEGVATLDARHITERHRLDAPGWGEVPSSVVVRFPDRDALFKERSVKVDSILALQRRGGVPAVDQLERAHVTSADQASLIAAEISRRSLQPVGEIELSVRRPFSAGLHPGAKVQVDVDPEPGGIGLAQLCVVQQIRSPDFGPVKLLLRPDTLVEATPYSPAWTPPPGGVPECPPIDASKAAAIPLPASQADKPSVAIMATRPAEHVIGFRVFFGTDPDGEFADLGVQPGFAVRAALDAAIDEQDTEIVLTLPDGDTGPDAYLAERFPGTEIGAGQDTLLLVLANLDEHGRVIMDEQTAELEFCSIVSRELDNGDMVYTVLRGRRGTIPRAWDTTTAAWIIPGESVIPWHHEHFLELTDGGVGYMRLVAYSTETEDTTTPIPEVTFALLPSQRNEPIVEWILPEGSQGVATGGAYTVKFKVIDGNGDLVVVKTSARRIADGVTTNYPDLNYAGTADSGEIVRELVDLPPGVYEFVVVALDLAGHSTVSSRTIYVEDTIGGSIEPVEFDPPGGPAFISTYITISTNDQNATYIQYFVGVPGYPVSDDIIGKPGFHTAPAPSVTFRLIGGEARVIARAGDGVDWSDWAYADYYNPWKK